MSDQQEPLSPKDQNPEESTPTEANTGESRAVGPGYLDNSPVPTSTPPNEPHPSPPSAYALTEDTTAATDNSTGRIIAIALGIVVIALLAFFGLRALFGGDATDGAGTDASITITNPTDGTVLEAGLPFTVEGNVTGVSGGTVIVQALDGNNATLAEATVTIAASDAETESWAVQLGVNVPPGTAGRIHAFYPGPDGRLAESSVAVIFGAADGNNSSITIDIPLAGEIVSPVEVVVTGSAADAPEPNIFVQALDNNNQVLASQVVVLGADGRWQATLQPNAMPNTPGRIAAMIGTSADQAVSAIAEINVIYGPGATIQPAISINIPQANAIVSPEEIVVVGTGTALPENNVVVRVLAADGAVLIEQPTTVNAEIGGTGPWQITLQPNAAPNTVGEIVAFATSPADGAVLAQASVQVTFGGADVPNPPAITIDSPQTNQTISPDEIVVLGTGTALPENNVVVLVVAADGAVLAEQPTTVAADIGGIGAWQAMLQFNATPGTTGQVIAFAPSPADGSNVATASVNVIFGERDVPNPPAISIASPQQDETVSPIEVVVSGTGTALPENNVVVRILADDDTVLAEQPTTVNADIGGTGAWQVTLQPNAAPGTDGEIIAFATSPVDGAVLVQASIDVVFGETGASNPPTITITAPEAGATINPVEVQVAGTGTALPENNVVVRVLAADGTVLAEQPTTVDADVGGTGEWQVTLQPNAAPGSGGQIVAFATSLADGSTIAEISVPVQFAAPQQ